MSESDNVFFFKHKRFWLHCGLNLLIFSTVNLFFGMEKMSCLQSLLQWWQP